MNIQFIESYYCFENITILLKDRLKKYINNVSIYSNGKEIIRNTLKSHNPNLVIIDEKVIEYISSDIINYINDNNIPCFVFDSTSKYFKLDKFCFTKNEDIMFDLTLTQDEFTKYLIEGPKSEKSSNSKINVTTSNISDDLYLL